jgi:hypothetical protein
MPELYHSFKYRRLGTVRATDSSHSSKSGIQRLPSDQNVRFGPSCDQVSSKKSQSSTKRTWFPNGSGNTK